MINFDLDNSQIGFLVAADHFGVVLYARRVVLQVHSNTVGFLYHVPIGDDETLGIYDHA